MGTKERETQEAKVENDAQKPVYSNKGIYLKLESVEKKIEKKIDSSSRIQKLTFIYAIGVAFIILGLSYYFAFLQSTGRDMTTFYLINIPGLLAIGAFVLVYASLRSKKGEEQKEVKQMGTKGRKNIKKPKMTKEQKEAKKKKK